MASSRVAWRATSRSSRAPSVMSWTTASTRPEPALAVLGRQRDRVDEAGERAAVDLEQQLGADHRLALRERARDRMQGRRQRGAVGRAGVHAGQVIADGPADVTIGAEEVDGGDVGVLDDAGGVDQEDGLGQRVEDRGGNTPGIELACVNRYSPHLPLDGGSLRG